jgi:hypothetical protein
MKVDIKNVWYGDVTYIPKEMQDPVIVKKETLNYNNNDLLNTAISFDRENEGQPVTLRIYAQFDGKYKQTPFVTDIPMGEKGIVAIKAVRIPQYDIYRSVGNHYVQIKIEMLKNVVGGLFKPVVYTMTKTVDFKIE